MSSTFGKNIRLSIFGQSHSEKIGVVVDGLPSGFAIDLDAVERFMRRRAAKKDGLSTARNEKDAVHIVSGVVNGVTCGAPLCAFIDNADVRSGDYENIKLKPRPAHADFTAWAKYGESSDFRGGGHFSGRLTAPLCFVGAVCAQMLEKSGITVGAHIKAIAGIEDDSFDFALVAADELKKIAEKDFPVINDSIADTMKSVILAAREQQDSVGGIIECFATGLPAGLGEPMFDGVENRISQAVFGIPAIKGIEFGNGFETARLFGSQNNDSFCISDGKIATKTNNHGGILGGITSGMPLVFRVAVKPTPSISKKQQSVDITEMTETEIEIHGRHDPCIVARAVPCVEAATAIVLLDMMMDEGKI